MSVRSRFAAVASFGAAIAVTVVGCAAQTSPTGTASPAPAVTVTATATATVTSAPQAEGISPTSLADLQQQLSGLGLSCDDYDETARGVAASCDDLILLGFSDGSSKQDQLMQASIAFAWQVIRDRDRQDEIALLVGDNWFVRLALTDAETLRDDLGSGGVILH